MTIKKTFYAATALLSFHAVQCMDSYDLYKETAFFKFIRTNQSTNPFSIEPEASREGEPKAPLMGLKNNKKHVQPQPKRKLKSTATSKSKRKKSSYKFVCNVPGCTKIFCGANTFDLTRWHFLHLYSKKHNHEKFNEVREYVQRNRRYNDAEEQFEVVCMHENCDHILQHKIPQNLTVLLVGHLYASAMHNKAEIDKFKEYIENCC